MIVRCGRCQIELEVSGPGEFLCPSCGTRNVVRGGAPAASDPFGLPDLGAPSPSAPTAPAGPSAGVNWVSCPSCSYRFAVGEVDRVDCPACSTPVEISEARASAE